MNRNLRNFYILTAIVGLVLLVLAPHMMAQDDPDPTVQGPTVLATSVPEQSGSGDGSLEFKLPPLDDEGYAWLYGIVITEFVVIVILVLRLHGSVPLSAINALMGIGKSVTRALPGTVDDRVYDWIESLVKPGLDPNRWPSLIQDAAREGLIAQQQADSMTANIRSQNLNPYQAYVQAEAMLRYYGALPAYPESAGAQAAKGAEFPRPV